MAATLTGTPVAINWAAGANPAGQSITIPSDATAVYMFWAYDGVDANGHGLASATLNGASPSQTFELPTAAGFNPATGVAAWYNPSTGSQTLDPAWDIAPVEGPVTIVAFVKGGDTTAWRDADADQATETTAVTVTLTTVSGDLVIKFDQRYDALENVPSLSAGWTNGATGGNVDEGCRLSYISATGTTQVCASENESYSSIVAISIPASTGSSITAGLGALTLTGLVPTVSATGGGNVSISSGLGQAVITGLAPTPVATSNHFVSAGLGQAVITGFAPTLAATGNVSVSAGLGQAVITGLAPTVAATNNVSITAALGQAVITGFAPSQTLTLSSPPAGALILSGHAPTVQVSAPGAITTGLGALVFTGFAPSVNAADSASITAGVGSLVATGLAPTVSATANVSITSALGQAVITGLAPGVAATANQFAAPGVGLLDIQGYAPAVTQAGSFLVSTGLAQLNFVAYSPEVANSGDVRSTGAGSRRRRERYIARFRGEDREFSTLDALEEFVEQAQKIEQKRPKKARAPIRIELAPAFFEELPPTVQRPAQLQPVRPSKALEQIRKLESRIERAIQDEEEENEVILWLM